MMNIENYTSNLEPREDSETHKKDSGSTDEDIKRAEEFLTDVAPSLGRLFGMDLSISIGNGWATNMETGQVTADPRFFYERGYTSDMCVYATLHEVAAHLRELVTEPEVSERTIQFISQGPANSIFHNIFSDIAGNNLIHTVLPKTMPEVAEQIYREKLFPEGEYSNIPRHLQFLYKIIRDEMIPDSQTTVRPEVDEAIQSLRNYEESNVDLIKYTTNPIYYGEIEQSTREKITADKRFVIWKDIIFPIYERLLQQDKDDPIKDPNQSESNEECNQPDNPENQSESNEENNQPDNPENQGESKDASNQPEQSNQPSNGEKKGEQKDQPFKKYYEDYHQNRHPEPLTEKEHEEIHKHATQNRSKDTSVQKSENNTVEKNNEFLDAQIQSETDGHTLAEQEQYKIEIIKWLDEIDEMREIYQSVINERIALKRKLSRKNYTEGAILDPNRLAQTFIDVQSGIDEPEAFKDYERQSGRMESTGKTDYVFLFDVSGSMFGERSQAAAACSVIALEGLAGMQSDIEEAEKEHNLDLELDIRTAIYSFASNAKQLKALSKKLDAKERYDTYFDLINANGGGTRDFLALENVQNIESDSERKQIIIVVTDGESDEPMRAKKAIDQLRSKGWLVYGISIGSYAAVNLYSPTSKRIDDPKLLPKAIKELIEETIS